MPSPPMNIRDVLTQLNPSWQEPREVLVCQLIVNADAPFTIDRVAAAATAKIILREIEKHIGP
jgi:hypothetical protein